MKTFHLVLALLGTANLAAQPAQGVPDECIAGTQARVEAGPLQAGLRMLTVPGDTPMDVALFYPTAVAARPVPMGPWLPRVAPGVRSSRHSSRA